MKFLLVSLETFNRNTQPKIFIDKKDKTSLKYKLIRWFEQNFFIITK